MNEAQMFERIAGELNLREIQVRHTIQLLDDQNTVPFIARYRKEQTGSLDENQIRAIEERINYLRNLQSRKETILKSIEEQGKLTPELAMKIKAAMKNQELEDLYLPYKPKKRTRGTIARERGLEPLALHYLAQESDIPALQVAAGYVNPEKDVPDARAALAGACDIIAETMSETAEIRQDIRQFTWEQAVLNVKARDPQQRSEYETYYDFAQPAKLIQPYRVLAINRGEKEDFLKVKVLVDAEHCQALIGHRFIKGPGAYTELLSDTAKDAYQRLIAPSIEREIRSELRDTADGHAIHIFASNLKNLLLQPPVKQQRIMGIDPGFRTGCKVAVIDETGKYLTGVTIYPHPPQNEYLKAKETVRRLAETYQIDIIAIGNGTASRETEQMTAELIAEMKAVRNLHYIIVSEAGASVYSASEVAQKEFPDLEASMRGNISIARRLLDPLAELVKIDPKSIGVGLYQHDVNQRQLTETLQQVVETCVNQVGVNLNTASASLLRYVSGLTSRTAENIVHFRENRGAFRKREDLLQVDGIGAVAFEQAAGFLRIPEGEDVLDNTFIHPESYQAARELLKISEVSDLRTQRTKIRQNLRQFEKNLDQLLTRLNIGKPTYQDILTNLEKPGLDPRDEMPKPIFKSDVLKMEDLKEGMRLTGTVRNVVDFGAFVDIGVKQDGLIHISQLANKFVKNPLEVIAVGDIVEVKITTIDMERGRIGLSRILD